MQTCDERGRYRVLNLGSTTVGGVVTTRQIEELPLNGRKNVQIRRVAAQFRIEAFNAFNWLNAASHHPCSST